MSLVDDVNSLRDDISVLKAAVVRDSVDKPKRFRAFKVPGKFRSMRQYRKGKFLVVWLSNTHQLDFKWGMVKGGNVEVEVDGELKSYHAYEAGAVYFHKKFPACVVFEWRLTPAGGDSDKEKALASGDVTAPQQTIIRAIKQAELDKGDALKKRKGLPPVLLIVGGVVLLYFVAKGLGWV